MTSTFHTDDLESGVYFTGVFTEVSRRFFWSLDFTGFVKSNLYVLRESGFWLYST